MECSWLTQVMREGIGIALGSDSQAQIDPLEDARELEYHLRLDRHNAPSSIRLASRP